VVVAPVELTRGAGRVGSAAHLLASVRARLPRDARVLQIASLAMLLGAGVLARDFSLRPEQMLLAFSAGLITQVACLRCLRLDTRSVLSAVITCLGLSILLRADALWVHPLVASVAIASKFLLRIRGRHVLNPANLGVVLALTLLPGTWVSAGQWGHDLAAAVWFVMLGTLVTGQARRWETSWIFLATWLGLAALRTLWLGQPPAVLLHQAGNGALLLFAFFMISDPMTTPARRAARIVHAVTVAAVAFVWQFILFRTNGLVWALFICVPLVPLLDWRVPGPAHRWTPHSPAA